MTYWWLPFGFATYLADFGVLKVTDLVPIYGGRFREGMRVRLYAILCTARIAHVLLVAIVIILRLFAVKCWLNATYKNDFGLKALRRLSLSWE